MKYKQYKVKIIKRLGVIDREGEWVQIEVIEGKDKGMRRPVVLEDIK